MPVPGFTMIPNEVIFADITPQAKALFLALSSYAASDSAMVWPSRKTLARLMGMSLAKSVDKYITELEGERFISRQFRPNQSTLYEVARWSREATSCRLPGEGYTPQGTTPSTLWGITQYPTGDTPLYPTGYTNNTHSSIPKNQTHLLPISSVDFCSDDSEAPRRGGQLPAEETREPLVEEQETEMDEPSKPVEEKKKDAGDGIDIRQLMTTPPERLSWTEEEALRNAKWGWDHQKKVWVDLSMW